MTHSKVVGVVGGGVLLVLALPSDAWAYIDPGTGSYFFKLVIASGLAGVYTLRRHWYSVRSWFGRRKDPQ